MKSHYFYFAATTYEGCGHEHRTVEAAQRCLPRIDDTHGLKPAVYKVQVKRHGTKTTFSAGVRVKIKKRGKK